MLRRRRWARRLLPWPMEAAKGHSERGDELRLPKPGGPSPRGLRDGDYGDEETQCVTQRL
jgi:hypothetical protein